ncbi:hypothetical protein GCM10009678_40120 [Actinomadura kijaniata]
MALRPAIPSSWTVDTLELRRIAEAQDDNWWYRERRAVLTRELNLLRTWGRGPGTAVDIGAGPGDTARLLARHGWRTTAVDLSYDAVEMACARGVDCRQADARWLPLPAGSVDLALAWDVLAHIEDDDLAAAEIARVLRPGGTALVAVPCDMALWSARDLALGRVRRYTREGLARLLAGAGLVVERMWSWNVLLRPLARWHRHRMNGWEIRPRHPLHDRLLGAVLALEDLLPVRSWRGTTLLARARLPK